MLKPVFHIDHGCEPLFEVGSEEGVQGSPHAGAALVLGDETVRFDFGSLAAAYHPRGSHPLEAAEYPGTMSFNTGCRSYPTPQFVEGGAGEWTRRRRAIEDLECQPRVQTMCI